MTHDPRYPPRPQPPAPRPGWHQQYPAQQYPPAQYPAPQPQQRPNQPPYEWRHVAQQHTSPYDTAITAALPVVAPDTRRRSRAGVLFAGAVAVSVVICAALTYPVTRLRGHYFAIATVAMWMIAQPIGATWSLINGSQGLFIPVAAGLLGEYWIRL